MLIVMLGMMVETVRSRRSIANKTPCLNNSHPQQISIRKQTIKP
jgi:hypothetical protein